MGELGPQDGDLKLLNEISHVSSTSSLLTVIITTSPTPSAPSTELISLVLNSYKEFCPSLLSCNIIIVFDTYDRVSSEARLKKGSVTAEQARDYNLYKENVRKLILDRYLLDGNQAPLTEREAIAEYGITLKIDTNTVPYTTSQSPCKKVSFIYPARRLGFGLAVRSALRLTETPYVFIHQHDWVLTSPLPIRSLLHAMAASEQTPDVPIKYVCLPAPRMLQYAIADEVIRFPALRALTKELKRDFLVPFEDAESEKVPLTPLFFWHDKPHLASTKHYLERVFPSRLAMLRGDFIEDKIGQRARGQMKEGLWTKWATWLYYPEEGRQLCLRHLKGRTWEGQEKEARKINELKERGRILRVASSNASSTSFNGGSESSGIERRDQSESGSSSGEVGTRGVIKQNALPDVVAGEATLCASMEAAKIS